MARDDSDLTRDNASGDNPDDQQEQSEGGNWLAQNIWAPVVNGSGVLQQYNNFTDKDIAPLDQGHASMGSPEWGVQTVATVAGAIVPYFAAGKLAGKMMGSVGEATAAKGLTGRALNSQSFANVLGAGAYDFAREPLEGETRAGTALGSMAAFSAFGAGNHLIGKTGSLFGSTPGRLIGQNTLRFGAGASGGLAGFESSQSIDKLLGERDDRTAGGRFEHAISGGLLNVAMPAAQSGLNRLLARNGGVFTEVAYPAESAPTVATVARLSTNDFLYRRPGVETEHIANPLGGRPIFSSPENAENFVRRMQPMFKSWQKDDLTPLYETSESLLARREQLAHGTGRLIKMFVGEKEIERHFGSRDLDHYALEDGATMRSMLKRYPDARRICEQYVRQSNEINAKFSDLNKAEIEARTERLRRTLGDRRGELETGVNSFLQEHNMPRVSIRWSDNLPGNNEALYYQGQGAVYLPGKSLAGRIDPKHLSTVVAHELTHLDQDNQVLRRRLDRMNVGESMTPPETNAIKTAYERDFKTKLDPDFLQEIVSLRAGQKLDSGDVARATRLSNSPPKEQVLKDATELISRYGQLDQFSALVDERGVARALRDINEPNGSFLPAEQLFAGSPRLGALTDLLQTQKKIDAGELPGTALNEAQALALLKDIVSDTKNKVLPAARRAESAYMNMPAEKEAHAIEPVVESAARRIENE